MNAPLYAEVLLGSRPDAQPLLPLVTGGVARWVWESRFGSMLIEVVDGDIFVNGQRVVTPAPALPADLDTGLVSAPVPST